MNEKNAELIKRLREHANCHSFCLPDDEQIQWAADLRQAAEALQASKSAAEADPFPLSWTISEIAAMRAKGWVPATCKICGESCGAIPMEGEMMDEADVKKISELAILAHQAKLKYDNFCAMNRSDDPAGIEKDAVKLALIEAEYLRAKQKLTNAQYG